jgi:hypothetical protein
MIDYNYIDESLENEMNNLELPDTINQKIDKDYELDFPEDEVFNMEINKNIDKDLSKSSKKNLKNINTRKSGVFESNKPGLDEEFNKYLNDLDYKIEKEVLREELEKNQAELNLNRNIINLGTENDKARANKIIEEDESIRKAIENKVLSFEDIVDYVDYYQIFTFVNKSQKLALNQFSIIVDLCETETFEETEDDIKKRIESTLKITDKILDDYQFSPQEIVFLDEKKRSLEKNQKEEQRKKNEKEYIIKQNELENKKFLQQLILTTRHKHIEVDDLYDNVDDDNIKPEESEEKKEEKKGELAGKTMEKAFNKIDKNEVQNIVENDKEYKFLEKITKIQNYHRNLKIDSNKNNNRIFFAEKDLEDLENYKKGKIKNDNNFNENSNPLHNFYSTDNEPWLQKGLNNEDCDENYKNLVADLYKKHGLEMKERNIISSNNIRNRKIKNDNAEKQKIEKLSQTMEVLELHKKYGNLKKMIPPLKNKNVINSNAIAKLHQINSKNLINNLIIKNKNVDYFPDNDLKSQISENDSNSLMKESLSKLSFRSKISNNKTTLNKTNPINNIDLFTTDNKMMNLIKVRDQRKEYLKTKIGNKSNKRPDLFSFNATHILINDQEGDGYDKIFEIIQEAKSKNKNDLCFLPGTSNSNVKVDKSIDSVNSKKSSVRKKIETAINYSKNKIY